MFVRLSISCHYANTYVNAHNIHFVLISSNNSFKSSNYTYHEANKRRLKIHSFEKLFVILFRSSIPYIVVSILNLDFVFNNLNVMLFYTNAANVAATFAMWLATKAETCHNDGKYQNR